MKKYDEHKVKERLEASKRARPSFRDSETYLTFLLGLAGLFAFATFAFIVLVIVL